MDKKELKLELLYLTLNGIQDDGTRHDQTPLTGDKEGPRHHN